MKFEIKDNKLWVAAEKKKQKKRIKRIILGILFLLLATGVLYLINWYGDKSGNFYPDIKLEDTPTNEAPQIYISPELTDIIKCPSIPYTMVMSGEFVTEGSTYCVFLDGNYYLSVCEISKNANAPQVLQTIIIPSLNGIASGTKVYKAQKGYLNNRYMETFGCTIELSKAKLYTINYRIFINDDTDLLLTAMCGNKGDLTDANSTMKDIFYTLHELDDAAESTTQANIEGITENMVSDGDMNAPMDEGYLQPGEAYEITMSNGFSPVDENKIYKQNCEKTIEITEEIEHAYICFGYDIDRELDNIVLYDPSGENMYFPEPYDYYGQAEYVFKVDNPTLGEWKFVFSASGEIGYYRAYAMRVEDYKPLKLR